MKKPVFFFTFANNFVEKQDYLRNLANEWRSIKSSLQEVEKSQLCTIEDRQNVTVDEIFDTFQDKRWANNIALFHFAGHADSYRLLLESVDLKKTPAHSKGLVSFLGRQQNLQLIFLNGCSTEQQAIDLIEAGVPAVIGTSSRINDKTAQILAARFYNGIGQGGSISKSWEDAKSQIDTVDEELYRDITGFEGETDLFPWRLYIRKGAEKVEKWNLPKASGDPLFGLPLLPDDHYLPDMPFRYLRRFEKEHAELFFGRGAAIRDLYERVTNSKSEPVILLHGQSGVGKSSLLEAGLFPRLASSAQIKFLRRDAAKGLIIGLNELLAIAKDKSLKEHWLAYEKKQGQPLHIVLDQVEEIFTQPCKSAPEELIQLSNLLKELFYHKQDKPQGKIILSFRKEFYPEINKALGNQNIPRSNFLVERLDRAGIIEIVNGLNSSPNLRQKYELKIGENLAGLVAEDLLGDQVSAIAPTLQILLTKMWLTDQKLSENPQFTTSLYQQLKKKGYLLSDFLQEQLDELEQWDKEFVQSGLALNLLAFYTTDKGTSRQRTLGAVEKRYPDQEKRISSMVQKMKDSYLLIDTGAKFSKPEFAVSTLAHDTLAILVREKFDKSDHPGSRALRVFNNRISGWEENQSSTLLSRNELKVLEAGKSGMRKWTDVEEQIFKESQTHYQKRDRQKKVMTYAIAGLLLFGLITGFFFYKNNLENQSLKVAVESENIFGEGEKIIAENPTMALEKMEKGWQILKSSTKTAKICNLYREHIFYDTLFTEENDLINVIAFNTNLKVFAFTKKDLLPVYLYRWEGTKAIFIDSLEGPGNDITDLVFSEDGQLLIAGATDRKTHVWDWNAKTHQALPKEAGLQSGHVDAVAISADNKLIASGHADTLRVWDRASGELLKTVPFDSDIQKIAFRHDHATIWIAHDPDKLSALTNLSDSPNEINYDKNYDKGSINNIQRINSGLDMFHMTEENAFKWYNQDSLRPILKKANNDQSRFTNGISSSTGEFILTISDDKKIKVWDSPSGLLLHTLSGHIQPIEQVVFDEKNNSILTASSSNIFRWTLPNNAPSYTLKEKGDRIQALDFSSKDNKLIAGTGSPSVDIWDLAFQKSDLSRTANNRIEALAFNESRSHIFSGDKSGLFQQWPMGQGDGKTIHQFKERINTIDSKGDYTLIASDQSDAFLWKTNSSTPINLTGHRDNVLAVDISSDANYGLTGSSDSLAILWKLTSGEKVDTFFHKNGEVRALTFFDDGHSFLSIDNNSYLYYQNLDKSELEIRKIQEENIKFLLADPASRFYVTASASSIQVWHREGALLRQFETNKIRSLALSPDGKWIFSGNQNGEIHAWKNDLLPKFLFK